MRVSVVITVLNEEESIRALLESLLAQSKRADEIVIIDGGSTDRTRVIIRHLQKKNRSIKLLLQKSSRAEARNLGVDIARNDIIAMTDAGCVAQKHWLRRLTGPFKYKATDMVAGFYRMVGETPLERAFTVFLGVTPSRFDADFLPSARSMAFTKELWERIGGFPEHLTDTADDTIFNHKAIKASARIVRVKTAIVEWGMPKTFREFGIIIFQHARGDAKSKVWWNSTKRLASHNIKVIFIFLRYLAGITLLYYSFSTPLLLWLLLLGLILYIFYSFRKVYFETEDWAAGLWGIILQFSADFSVMVGFVSGMVLGGKKSLIASKN